jgi:hypothetical protein
LLYQVRSGTLDAQYGGVFGYLNAVDYHYKDYLGLNGETLI